jgi:hypothetical protein
MERGSSTFIRSKYKMLVLKTSTCNKISTNPKSIYDVIQIPELIRLGEVFLEKLIRNRLAGMEFPQFYRKSWFTDVFTAARYSFLD